MRRAPFSVVSGTASRRRSGLLTAAALGTVLAAAPASAVATPFTSPGGDASARIEGRYVPSTKLPSSTATAARSSVNPSGRWVIAASGDRQRLAEVAAAAGGTYDATLSILSVPTAKAAAIAAELGSAVKWAEPDAPAVRSSSYDRPGGQSEWSRNTAAAPSLTPAAGSLARIGIVDDAVDRSVAELASANVINGVGAVEPHGTMVASTAAAPFDGAGVVGVAPGAPVLSWGTTLLCSDVATGVTNLVKRGAQVINLSLGFTQHCGALLAAVEYTYAKNVTMVVASGNDGDNGNPLSFPASYPHVITAAAVDSGLNVASFSNFNQYVDVAAPGVDVPVDVPLRWDVDDDTADGQTTVSGTSFASPFVAGGVSWILGARPGLDPSQVAGVLRAGVRDIATPGWDAKSGFGLLQIAPSMVAAAPAPDVLEPNDFPEYTTGKGTYKKKTIWSGKKSSTITASADSADDYIDAYRIKVPPRTTATIKLAPAAGAADLFGFDQSVRSFEGRPIDASTKAGTATDTIRLRNSGRKSRIAFVVVAVPESAQRQLVNYTLTVKR